MYCIPKSQRQKNISMFAEWGGDLMVLTWLLMLFEVLCSMPLMLGVTRNQPTVLDGNNTKKKIFSLVCPAEELLFSGTFSYSRSSCLK